MDPQAEHHELVIIGAGFGGIALATKLHDAGIEDFVILERAGDLGGTWRDNTYPGCACDVPSHLYSLSFAPNPDWSRTYGTQPEILAYLHRVAEDNDIVRHIAYNTELVEANWDEDARHWVLNTNTGVLTATVLISATGVYGEAKYPDIPGVENFAGTAFHSLHWDHDHDLTGERVAVLGTGASAVQIIPEIAPKVLRLKVFQRSAPWIVPRMDRHTSAAERALLRRFPLIGRIIRSFYYAGIESFGLVGFVNRRFRHPFELLGKFQLRRQVRDKGLRKTLTPDYMIGCKRAIFADDYLPALTRDNVDVIATGIEEIRAGSIVTRDGVEHPVDTIIYATGFIVPPAVYERIRSTGGHSYSELYAKRPQSYLGVAIAGFPNFFATLAPFGAVGNQSAIYMIEAQSRYIVDAITTMRRSAVTRVEVRSEVQEAFLDDMNTRSQKTVWLTGGCASSYYHTEDGRNAGLYPGWSFEYAARTSRFDRDAYELSVR
ncbi:flavin-containing monooxygenase [[Mycobacterium] crassicus]|uniref:NAD(P)/FAD-dependent oxidoreductase n=1 Tax=[Mycobacterium] crassicus TaxID=2872309 RepID=A0ABU5XM73_9MYCO|nr:NAD(P)/FAD-dependent oxidoreductase [Mycolicibacter sp. MYC098]MEB3022842.1 NAD(P)/FAD-dependent oxidoreductase [Mycolicibacter sp. MYC098]